MSSCAHAPAVLTHGSPGVGFAPVRVSAGLRRAFSLGTDVAVDTWVEVTGHRGALAWVHWQVRAVLYHHGMTGAAADRYAITVAQTVAREAGAAVEVGRDPRRAVLSRIPREAFKAAALWPGLCPVLDQAEDWEQFLGAAHAFYAQANSAAAAAVAASETATTFGSMSAEDLGVETAKIARWLWGTFAPEAVPVHSDHEALSHPWTRKDLRAAAGPGVPLQP